MKTIQTSNQIPLFNHEQNWNTRTIRYELKQLRRESEHLLKKSRQRELSSWEYERIQNLSQEIGMLVLAEANLELQELLAA